MSDLNIQHKLLATPFNKDGSPALLTSIVATLLPNVPLTKEALLAKIDEKHLGNTRGYLSNLFAELKKQGVLKFDKRVAFRNWSQGENYQEYMGFIFMELVKLEAEAVDSLQYKLMPKKAEQSMDFIMSPKEDIFNKPNQFIEEPPKEKKSVADGYLDLQVA